LPNGSQPEFTNFLAGLEPYRVNPFRINPAYELDLLDLLDLLVFVFIFFNACYTYSSSINGGTILFTIKVRVNLLFVVRETTGLGIRMGSD